MQSVKVEGDTLLAQVRQFLYEGNVRRIRIKDDGRTIVEFPLSEGAIGPELAPVLGMVGVLGALLADCTVEVERTEPSHPAQEQRICKPEDELAAVRWGAH
jgi:hypothetical protein